MDAMKRKTYTEDENRSVLEAFGLLKKAFPGLSPKQIVEGPMAHHALGDLPPWSSLETHRLTDVMTALRGAFVLCWFRDAENNAQTLMGARPKTDGTNGTLYNASGGGFANLDFTPATTFHPASKEGEQPAQTAARELCEEVRDDKGIPVLDLDPQRFELIAAGVDNRALKKGGHPTDWCGYLVELTKDEAEKIARHCAKVSSDADYSASCKEASNGETAFVKIIPLQEAAKIPVEQFAHPHESTVLKGLVARMARSRTPQQKPGV